MSRASCSARSTDVTPDLFTGPARREVPLDGAAPLIVIDRWLAAAAATALFDVLHDTAPWFRPTVRIWGEEHLIPRTTAWYGDAGAVYRYSGTVNTPAPWTPALEVVREALVREAGGAPFNSVLLNLYRDGKDHVAWHADDEPGLGADPLIASLSLGASRRFVLRKTAEVTTKVELLLEHGTLLLMGAGVQKHWQHSIPKQAAADGPRINLTWRHVQGKKR